MSRSIPATIQACSTRRWPRSNGRSCRPTFSGGAAAGEAVGIGLGMFVEKSGLGPFDGSALDGEDT